MFLAILRYKVSRKELEPYLPSHRAFLDAGYARGDFIVSGRMMTGQGGVILSPLTRLVEFGDILLQDPFKIHDLADYEIIAFDPSRFHPDFASFIREPYREEIELVPYTPQWEVRFQEEADLLSSALKKVLITIHHIGSTSIPDIVAKPIVDMIPVVTDIQAIDPLIPALEALGYESRGEYGMPGRRFLIKKHDGKRTFNVHIFEKDHPDIERHLRFRDYLRTHSEEREAYSRLKKELVSESQDDIEKYCWGKEDFIKSIEVKSLL